MRSPDHTNYMSVHVDGIAKKKVCLDHCQLNPAPFFPLLLSLPFSLLLQRRKVASPAQIPPYTDLPETYCS